MKLRSFSWRYFLCLILPVTLGCWGCSDPLRDSAVPEELNSMSEKQLRVEELSVLMTSGTLVLREIRGAQAVFFEDERIVQATSVTLKLNLPEHQQRITASAKTGEVYLGKEKSRSRDAQKDQDQAIGYEAMQELAQAPASSRVHGDIVLRGDVEGSTEDGGHFRTQTVLWSERLHRLLVPGSFSQVLPPPGGGMLMMEGEAFEVDSTLRHWTYYGDKRPFALEWDATRPPSSPPTVSGPSASALAPGSGPVAPDSRNTSPRRSSSSQ